MTNAEDLVKFRTLNVERVERDMSLIGCEWKDRQFHVVASRDNGESDWEFVLPQWVFRSLIELGAGYDSGALQDLLEQQEPEEEEEPEEPEEEEEEEEEEKEEEKEEERGEVKATNEVPQGLSTPARTIWQALHPEDLGDEDGDTQIVRLRQEEDDEELEYLVDRALSARGLDGLYNVSERCWCPAEHLEVHPGCAGLSTECRGGEEILEDGQRVGIGRVRERTRVDMSVSPQMVNEHHLRWDLDILDSRGKWQSARVNLLFSPERTRPSAALWVQASNGATMESIELMLGDHADLGKARALMSLVSSLLAKLVGSAGED